MEKSIRSHWENVYENKNPEDVSWTQEFPKISLEFIDSFHLPKTARIIDIGGGDSKLADYLLEAGFTNISVLDISEKALEKAKKRLGTKAQKITWIVSNILDFKPETTYDVWHDRAAFHFLQSNEDISTYQAIAEKSVSGNIIIGTFSKNGPEKCSGLPVKQYNEDLLTNTFETGFEKLNCKTEDHITPFGTKQEFLFCSFNRRPHS